MRHAYAHVSYLRPEEVDDTIHLWLQEGQFDAVVAGEGRPALSEGHLPPLLVLGALRRRHLVVEPILDVERLFQHQEAPDTGVRRDTG